MTWYKETVFYHIYPLGLLKAPKINDHILSHRLLELTKWLDHISELGIDALYIGPLFESVSHGYDTIDYKLVDMRLGTNDDFKALVDYAHAKGIKVVVDGVFNHTSKQFYAFKDILSKKWDSPYRDYYHIDFSKGAPSGEPFDFKTWSGYYELAKLNLDNPKVQDMLLDVVDFWISEFKIDGIRLDCADCLSFDFIKKLKSFTAQKKDDFWLMGELIHGDYSRFIKPELLDSSTNYELHKGLFSAHNDHNYFEIAHTVKRQFDPMWGLYKGFYLYNFVDNHDVDRLVSKLQNRANVKNVYAIMFTLIGIPSIYYGSEWNIEGKRDAYSDDVLRPCIKLEDMRDNDVTKLIKKLVKIKKEHPSLSYGSYKDAYLTNRQYAYIRSFENDHILVIANNDEDTQYFDIAIDGLRACTSLLNEDRYKIDGNVLHLHLAANDSDIIALDIAA